MRTPLSRDRVLDAALAMVEAEGVDALTMRGLAARLGVAVTAIYWHVGDKSELLAALVDRIGDEVGDVEVRGRTPQARVLSIARSLRRNLVAHRDLVSLTHHQGRHAVVFLPARRALADAFSDAGLRGARLTAAVESVVHLVVGSVLIERAVDRSPAPRANGRRRTGSRAATDHDGEGRPKQAPGAVFESSLMALVRGLV